MTVTKTGHSDQPQHPPGPVAGVLATPDPAAALLGRRPWPYLALLIPPTGVPAMRKHLAARRAARRGDSFAARALAAEAATWSWYSAALAFIVLLAAFATLFLTANDHAVIQKFFNPAVLRSSAPEILRGFLVNVELFLIAEVLVLPWALFVACLRMLPGPASKPIRGLAIAYTDLFRGLPAVVAIYLIAFGFPIAGLPVLGSMTGFELCVLALVLIYGAYVSEVFRAGLQSVHWSQASAARSLGLSYVQTLRHVIAPQAIRRMIPPLLNDFIGLQKDTALVSFVGLLDAFNESRIVASNEFNLSAVTGVGIAFVLITIPTARLVDRLTARDAQRRQGSPA
jgi:polar amino acid transport system permease protein